MGLFSDYLEYSREHDDYDPCLYISKSWKNRIDHDYSELLGNTVSVEIYEDLEEVADYLDILINRSVLREKAARYILNNSKIESVVAKQTIELLLEEITLSRTEAIKSQDKLNVQIKKSGKPIHRKSIQIDEAEERENVKDILLFSLYKYIKSGEPETSPEFHVLVMDCAKIINLWSDDGNNKSKDVFKNYLRSHYDLRHSQYTCQNCGAKLYIGIPFCLNCYEKEKK